MESAVASPSACPLWAFLPTDLLFRISDGLHDPRDFVRFNAVCQPWREAAPAAACRHKFRPWLVSQHPGRGMLIHNPVFYSRSVSPHATSSTHRIYDGNVLQGTSNFDIPAWVAGPDGSAVRRFVAGPEPTLQDLVTGDVTRLPPFPRDNNGIARRMSMPHGVVYDDGTVFLYSFVKEPIPGHSLGMPVFTAAIMRPGDTAWTVIERRLRWVWGTQFINSVAYHHGKALVWLGNSSWCIMKQELPANGGNIDIIGLETMDYTPKERRYMRVHNYVFESRGELLWASVLLEIKWYVKCGHKLGTGDPAIPALEVKVHALEEEADGKMRWVERDGRGLDDRVLFLGFPGSFAADATQLGMDGGCAYFVFHHRLFRYNLVDGETEAVESPHIGWISPVAHVWLRPKPVVASIQEIRQRLSLHQDKNKPK